MTKSELEAIVKGLMPVIVREIDRRIDARLGPQTSAAPSVMFHQVDPASLKPGVVHRGEWDPERVYSDADGVVCKGLAYRAVSASVRCEPGTDERAWEHLA